MATKSHRKAPERDALEHVVKAIDKTAHLEVKFINSVKGRGLFAKSHFEKGNFVVEYRGQLIRSEESKRRRRVYHSACTVFMFDFYWQERRWCIDAAQEDGSFGRIVNDDHIYPNCRMKKVIANGKPHLCLFAVRDIIPGEEITYNYGGTDWPWRKKAEENLTVTKSKKSGKCKDLSLQSSVSRKKIVEKPIETNSAASEAPKISQQDRKKIGKKPPVTKSAAAEAPEIFHQAPVFSSVSKKKIEEDPAETKSAAVEAPETSQQPAVLSSVFNKKIEEEPAETKSAAVEAPETSQQPVVLSSVFKKKIKKNPLLTKSATAVAHKIFHQAAVFSSVSQKRINEEPAETRSAAVEAPETSQQPAVLSSVFNKKIEEEPTETKSAAVKAPETSQQPAVLSSVFNKKIEKNLLLTKSATAVAHKIFHQTAVFSSASQNRIEEEPAETKSAAVEAPETSQQPAVLSSVFKKKIGKKLRVTKSAAAQAPEIFHKAAVFSSVSKKKIEEEPAETRSAAMEAPETSQQPAVLSSVFKRKIEEEPAETKSAAVEAPETSQQPAVLSSVFKKKRCNPSVESSDEDQQYVPKLRRTKSIQITRQTDFDSPELFDTPDVSEEEYLPSTSEDSSDMSETDTSEVFEIFNQKKIIPRGRSPTRKGNDSALKRRRQRSTSSSPATRSFGGQPSEQNETPHTEDLHGNSTLVCPDSTTSLIADVADDSLTIPAVCKKKDGSRQYNKKQYCLYCKEGFIKMARHLERAHKNEREVAQAVSFPKGSKQRRLHLDHLRNRGNFAHNVDVLNTGVGKLVPRKQPKEDSKSRDFLHCVYCQGLFTKKVMWRHMMICKFKPSVPQKPGKTRVQALCAFAVPPPPGVKAEFWKVLNSMNQDEVYSAVKSDVSIIEYGEHLFNKLGYDDAKHEYIRQKMRELGRLLVVSRKTTTLKTIEDHIKPENFMHVVQAVQHVAGFVSESHTYKRPSLALKIGHSLVKISQLLESRANVQSNYTAAKYACSFRRVYEARWNELISAASLRTLHESKWNVPQLIPFTKDVQKLHSYLDMQQEEFCSKLSLEPSKKTWAHLTKITLTQVMMFNRRRTGEVSKMPLSAYFTPNPLDLQEDVGMALSDLEKKLCQHFRRLEIRGKRGRKVPVLLTPEMQQSLDLLVAKRQECGVLKENGYLFARPSVLTCYRGSDCIRDFAKACGIKNYTSLTSTKLRKQTGTLSQVLNLSNTELDQLADFLGHDVRVHRQFYRLPEGTLQLAKVSKVLLALEQGRLAEFKGKSLDEITIDPEEIVNLDSDYEAQGESDTQESCVEPNEMTSEMTETMESDVRVECHETLQGSVTSTQTSKGKSPKKKKGGPPMKKRMWQKDEILAVEKHMMSFITSCRVPGKSDCDKCLAQEKVALKQRNWLAVKFYIKNRITALKHKV